LKCVEGGFASGKWHTNQRTNQTGVVIQLTTLPVRTCIDLMVSSAFSAAELRVEKPTCSTVKYSHRSEKSSDAGNDRITIDFRTDIRPPHQPQREPELGLGEATVRPPTVPPQQDSLHIQQDFQSAAGITLAELEKDLRYQCVKAQLEPWESQDHCSVLCAKWYIYSSA